MMHGDRTWTWREHLAEAAAEASALIALRRPVAADACRCAAGQHARDAAVDGGRGARRIRAVRDQHDAPRRRPGRRHPARPTASWCSSTPSTCRCSTASTSAVRRCSTSTGPTTATRWRRRNRLCRIAKSTGADPVVMLFTSGTSGDPKAVRFAHAMAVLCGASLAERFELTADDVCYLSMPLFHSNGVAAGWAVALACGATMVPAKFSPSRFLPDIRRYGATYMNYVGKPLALVLAHAREARRRRQHAARGVRQRGHRARRRRVRAAVRLPGRGQLRVQRVRRRRDARGRHARRDRSARAIRASASTTPTP